MSEPFRPVSIHVNEVIGDLDRNLSEMLFLATADGTDIIDAQTLKHHADDLIGVGHKILQIIAEREGTGKVSIGGL